jgi:hypothetical protein
MISKDKSDFIRTLADQTGHIEPADVVTAAREPGSPIHDEFEWEVEKAAQQAWLDHARRLIRLVKIEVTVENRVYRSVAYVSDPEREPKSRRYVDVTFAAQQRSTARAIITAEMDRIVAAIRRARELAMVLGLTSMLDELLADTDQIRAMAQKPRPSTKKKTAKKSVRARATTRRSHVEART